MNFFLVCLDLSLVKVGQPFGESVGQDFDDSLLANFTYTHYLSGLIISNIDEYPSCQFIYRSPCDDGSLIFSPIHGNYERPMNLTLKYVLDVDERIEEVMMISSKHIVHDPNRDHLNTVAIKKLQFKTSKDRFIPARNRLVYGDFQSERFPGYTLGYVTGKAALAIDQLQFVWYRTKP